MRKVIIAGNWKMNHSVSEVLTFFSTLSEKRKDLEALENIEIIIAPGFPLLAYAQSLAEDMNLPLKISAQNMYYENKGAFTGEVSAEMITPFCSHVIIGHSERRSLFFDTDEAINKKAHQSLSSQLTPIICIGESEAERDSNQTLDVVHSQIKKSLKDISDIEVSKVILAYEPLWAIGTGKSASTDQAQEVHQSIRSYLSELYSPQIASNIPILYGGSVKESNCSELLNCPDIDGALIGGASLEASSFVSIINKIKYFSK